MIAFVGIDGTGEFWNKNYKGTFANSHVKTIYSNWPYPSLAYYMRGPWWIGTDCAVEVAKAGAFLASKLVTGAAKGVIMAGYSRGAAGVIEVSWYLKQAGYAVDCLLLFDAVDRSPVLGGPRRDTPLVSTIREVYHALRDRNTLSRESFGNCGQTMESRSATTYESALFWATHGGVGGTPWNAAAAGKQPGDYVDEGFPDGITRVTYDEDKAGSARSWGWMSGKLTGALERAKARAGGSGKPMESYLPGLRKNWGSRPASPATYGPPGLRR
jgi:hypothetical protein